MTSGEGRFIQLYDSYQPRIANYCGRRVAADRIDDAVAETFLTVWRRIDDVPSGDSALPWLYGVAYKVIGRQWRTSSRRIKLDERLASLGREAVEVPDDVVIMREEGRIAIAAMEKLRPIDREILMLVGWEELPYSDVSLALGISSEAVRQRLVKAKKRLTDEYNRLERTADLGGGRGVAR